MAGLVKEIGDRRARRALSEKEIPGDTIARLENAATLAPSCFNGQPWRLMFVWEEKALQKVRAALWDANYWAQKAPLMIVVATKPAFDPRLSDGRDYAPFDCGLATENLLLQAVSEDLYAHPMASSVRLKTCMWFPHPFEELFDNS